jgi:hypothetical protein
MTVDIGNGDVKEIPFYYGTIWFCSVIMKTCQWNLIPLHLNMVDIPETYLPKIYFNIVPIFKSRSPQMPPPQQFFNQNFVTFRLSLSVPFAPLIIV